MENFLQWKLLFAKNNSQELAKENTKIYQKHGCFLIREKIITYGAFLESPYNSLSKNKGEEEWLKENLISFDYKHAWNSLMHYKMSRDLFANNSRQYLINFNDGLVPVYSSLFLDPGALGIFFQKKSIDPLLEKIKAPNYKYKSRLFFNLDHTDLTFEHEEETKIKDIITEEEKKNIAKFILEDLEL